MEGGGGSAVYRVLLKPLAQTNQPTNRPVVQPTRQPARRGDNRRDIVGLILVKEMLEFVKRCPDAHVSSLRIRPIPRCVLREWEGIVGMRSWEGGGVCVWNGTVGIWPVLV